MGFSVLIVQLFTMTYLGTLGLLLLCIVLVKSDMDDFEEKGEYNNKGLPTTSESCVLWPQAVHALCSNTQICYSFYAGLVSVL